MARTRTVVRDALKAHIDVIKGSYTVYTNKFMKSKNYPCIVIESSGSVNYVDAYDMGAKAYKFNIYVLAKLDSITSDDSGTVFDSALDTTQENVDAMMNTVLDAIQPDCYFVNENSNQVLDFTDGNNRLVGLVVEVRAENR